AALLTAVDEQLRGSGVWIRFLTSHPRDLRRDIVDLVRASAVICPYFHFPLQSGSDRILRAMNRGYVRESYLDMVHYIRQAIPEAGIGTDIIVGFPGETDRDFQDTLAVAREAEFEIAYTYTYSPRPHTAAGRIIDDVPPEVKKERLLVLNELVYSLYLDKIGRLVGKVSSVLVEHNGGKPAGKTPGNLQVCLSENGTLQLGQVSRVLFQEVRSGRLMGTVLADEP
ncbi:MAG TPA: radical SAM protein, partial [Atribacteraceae bacterium]|nr:radical SAM protein [Atribacteraceae bacterium]